MIRLGYQIPSGRAVDIPLAHTAVTGQTQQSGKTTTLEALVHRSGRRAIAFVTKRGEGSFRDAKPIPPYFRDGADWQFVSSILEALMGERMKFERSYIIDACRNAKGLADVHENIKLPLYGVRNPNHGHKEKGRPRDNREWLRKPATGFNQGILTNLCAYFDIVIPQIQKLPYTSKLELHKGLNVMDLSDYTTELQSLVIRSVLKWVYEHESHTIVIIPEAWEFIPQNRRSPVLLAAEELIRKGAAEGNFMWLDSQDIAAVHKSVLRSVGVWILGVQREGNEIKRMLAQIPRPAPTATDIMHLGKGEFFACFKDQLCKVYVQPFWVSDDHAEAVARGEESIATVERIWSEKTKARRVQAEVAANQTAAIETMRTGVDIGMAIAMRGSAGEDEAMWKEKYEAAQLEIQTLRERLDKLEHPEIPQPPSEPEGLNRYSYSTYNEAVMRSRLSAKLSDGPSPAKSDWDRAFPPEQMSELAAWLQTHPGLVELLRQKPTVRVTVARPVLTLNDETLPGKIGVLISEGFFSTPKSNADVFRETRRRWGVPERSNHMAPPLARLNNQGILLADPEGFVLAPNVKIETVNA